MSYLLSMLAGAVQGITEFLPISSSGHLLVFHDIFRFNFPDNLAFDVMLHLGTLVAIIIFFRKEIGEMIVGFFSSWFNWNWANDPRQRLAWLVVIGTIPAAIVGALFEDWIVGATHTVPIVALMLILVGLLFFVIEKTAKKIHLGHQLTKIDALIIGGAQVLALVPGVSRSGITIIAGLARNLKREEAAKFSFLLSAPIIFAAGVKKLPALAAVAHWQWPALILGFVFSALFGYLAIRFMIRYLSRHSLKAFAWYRLIIGCLILIWFFTIGR